MKNLSADKRRQVNNLQGNYFQRKSHSYNKKTKERREFTVETRYMFLLICSRVTTMPSSAEEQPFTRYE